MSLEKPYRDYDTFYQKYVVENKSLSELSDEWENSLSTLHRWRKKHNIPKYNQFTDKQIDVITGLLMGDGSINRSLNGNPRLEVGSITEEYLHYLNDKVFPVLGKNIRLNRTAEEAAKRIRERGFNADANKDNYSDIYQWYTESNPNLKKFSSWYSSGEKVWPQEIDLTPTTLKHWYCGDGNYQNVENCNHIRIYMSNERDNNEKISNYFKSAGLPTPNYHTYEYKVEPFSDYEDKFYAQFTIGDSEKLWEYMGKPLPGFEYKWPEEYRKV